MEYFEHDDFFLRDSRFKLIVNTELREVHLLDLDIAGTRSVTNNMNREFIDQLLKGVGVRVSSQLSPKMSAKFYWLGTDGVGAEFNYGTNETRYYNGYLDYSIIRPDLKDFVSASFARKGGELCPRCETRHLNPEGRNAQSRFVKGNVCSLCGLEEAMVHAQQEGGIK